MAPVDASELFGVPGMVAVVTGGGTGIGLMMARALAANGAAKVYIVGRRKEKLDAAAAESSGNIIPIVGDVTSKESLKAIADQIKSETGYINLVIANSGIVGPSVTDVPPNPSIIQLKDHIWNEWSMHDFTDTYNLNCTAVFFTAVAFLELLDAGNKKKNLDGISSQIIVTGSIASYLRAVLTGFAYVSSKAAAVHLMKCLSTYMVPFGIRCNAIAPGLFPSEISNEFLSKRSTSQPGSAPTFDRSFIPAERAGDEKDMGGTILYLVSRAGAYCNGVSIIVDGGRLSILPAAY